MNFCTQKCLSFQIWKTDMPPKRAVNQGMRESSILDQTERWQILMAESMGSVSEHRSESAIPAS